MLNALISAVRCSICGDMGNRVIDMLIVIVKVKGKVIVIITFSAIHKWQGKTGGPYGILTLITHTAIY